MRTAFVLGAGFSAPAGYPLAWDINSRFRELSDPHSFFRLTSTEWVWREHYQQEVSGPDGIANFFLLRELIDGYAAPTGVWSYEGLYQHAIDLAEKDQVVREELYERARARIRTTEFHSEQSPLDSYIDPTQARWELKDLFNGLISDLLRATATDLVIDQTYNGFIGHVRATGRNVSVVTLNHDLLLEKLFDKAGLSFSDGFTKQGSPITDMENNPLKVFNGQFPEPIKVYKLHGSVDMYRYYATEQVDSTTREFTGRHFYVKTSDFRAKHFNRMRGQLHGSAMALSMQPEFLTGNDKLGLITSDHMYRDLFQRGKHDLVHAEAVYVIGYGLGDQHINDMLQAALASDALTEMIVVNPTAELPQEWNQRNVIVRHYRNLQELPHP